ncbi:uncharacterized protein BO97DRAFT_434579 [Aspergillus homomorphus CBS 101889]|uniref:Aminoglycoside phosphotransferase domain-containing protein n=1 Tax=Aspergillus homomorphus (strain CBS 101889) TaxID=1450537 RepID=A0A395HZB2_ASPHC|nr:hypothetical protein BO97DRAFT_434579 [Aspergillus homomorphus CBS 101889]RAL12208.1 hypothetical protein BO97DRAFT_434579 [Aspergillus homomorphus CBS 101889]
MAEAALPLFLASDEAAQWNKDANFKLQIDPRTLDDLRNIPRREPEVILLSESPKKYTRKITTAISHKIETDAQTYIPKTQHRPDFRISPEFCRDCHCCLRSIGGGEGPKSNSRVSEELLIISVKHPLWDPSKLWESSVRDVVVPGSEGIVAKVTTRNDDYTERTIIQYLAEHPPGISVSSTHSLIALGPFCVVFITYSGMTLTQAGPAMTHEDKLAIQASLRTSSSRHEGSTYEQELGFIHGDVWIDNIMVKQDTYNKGSNRVSGIIDWDTLHLFEAHDWCLYLPDTISPLRSPVRWLVDRLWELHLIQR